MAEATTTIKGCSFLIDDPPPEVVHTTEELSDDVEMMADTIRKFIDDKIIPQADDIDNMKEGLMLDLFHQAGELGLLMAEIPEEYGGMGLKFFDAMYLVQYMAAGGSFGTASMAHVGIGTLPILFFAKPELKERLLPDLATGVKMAAYALTEPGAGSDALSAKCKAVPTEDGKAYLLTGNKQFITNGAWADVVTVFAKVNGEDDKFTAFVVETPCDGYEVSPEEHKLGIRGSSTCALRFKDCKVPADNILGGIGDGGKIALNILNLGRLKLGIGAVGGAKISMKSAVTYGMQREQFKTPIAKFGLIQQKIAMMASGIYAGDCMTMRTAGHCSDAIDAMAGQGGSMAKLKVLEEFLVECAIEKIYQSEMLDRVVDETVQIYGGYGFTTEYPAERYYRDARIARIYEGTNEINRLVIAGTLFKRVAQGRLALGPVVMKTMGAVMGGKLELPKFDGPLGEMKQRVWQAKRMFHLTAAAFQQGMGSKVTDQMAVMGQQECLGWMADMVMEIYAMESTMLRTQKLIDTKGQDEAKLGIALTLYHADRASRTIMSAAQNVITTIANPGAAVGLLKAADALNPWRPKNMRDLDRQIADAVIATDGELRV
ncbi:MAG: acyl-CoA dehydrogenase family protein [Phycisphaerae bacterium]|nr:acyl-CoA dehydrogenase family protein [Phycisphaerae bacterium]